MLQYRIEQKLQTLMEQAKLSQWIHGSQWYKIANDKSQALAYEFNLPLFKVVGVMAALSPNNKWERNLIDCRLFLANPSLETKVCTFLGQRKKALAILQAENESEVMRILLGRKTVSFFQNIMYYDSNELVTVDLWMFRIADLPHKKKNYELISQAVKQVSKQNDLLPHQLQAIVWSVVRPNK